MASLTLSSSFTPRLSRTISRSCPSSNSVFFSRRIRNPSFPSTKYRYVPSVKASVDFSSTYFQEEGDLDHDFEEDVLQGEEEDFDFEPSGVDAAAAFMEDREVPPCPPGCRQYETMAILRPDVSEEKRLALTQQYEELLVAGGGMYVEVFNRGLLPLSYSIEKTNRDGTKSTFEDGIYLLFTFFTKPESINVLETQLRRDFEVIRFTTFKIEKKKKDKEEEEKEIAAY